MSNKHKSQIGEFGTQLPIAVAKWSECCAVSLKVPSSILGQDSYSMFYMFLMCVTYMVWYGILR